MTQARYPGRVASPGVAYGTLRVDRCGTSAQHEPAQGIVGAVLTAAAQLRALEARTRGLGAEILEFQLELLADDQLVREMLEAAEEEGSPEAAIRRVFAGQIETYAASANEMFAARAADLVDLRDRLIGAFGATASVTEDWPDETILLVEDMTPSRFLELDRSTVVGIVDRQGSAASHVALLARAEGVPMVVGAGLLEGSGEGVPALLDAEHGELVIEPDAPARPRAGAAIADDADAQGRAVLPNGETVAVHLTVNSLDALAAAPPSWFDGIGLVRTELLIRDAQTLGDADLQAGLYRPLFDWAGERPLTIRLLDAGGDKPVPGMPRLADTGFLGVRGARLLLEHRAIMRTQLAGILRAAAGRPVRVMVPMVTLPPQLDAVREELAAVALEEGGDASAVSLGMMVETPAAALQVAAFEADFFGLGTNDLTQYTLAASRDADVGSGPEPISDAVLELVRRVAEHGAATGRTVTLCGDVDVANDGLGRLLENGVRSFSMPPRFAPRFKRYIRGGR